MATSDAFPITTAAGRNRSAFPPRLRLGRAAYTAAQVSRSAWYLGQYFLAWRLNRNPSTRAARAPEAPKLRFPSTADVLADLATLYEKDWAQIEAGLYRMPDDSLPPPGRALSLAARFFRDVPAVSARRKARAGAEVEAHPAARSLPRYYLRNFHYQTDGYLSAESASLYDHQVEVLFVGGAAAMRRQTMGPIREALRGKRQQEVALLDLACGTGGYLKFVKRNLPRLNAIGIDLSPAYAAHARETLKPWGRTTILQAAAEALPFADASLDIVTCIYLFHELPRAVRGRVVREVARVLKPGGRFVFLDSLQPGDHPPYDGLLQVFPKAFHEPYYRDYGRQDLAALFASAGLRVAAPPARAFFSKLLVADKV
jgi:ubiquinone/menaquinone biosynthesis C-methylase UbiE